MGAKLKVHGIARSSLPVASPFESGHEKLRFTAGCMFPAVPWALVSGFRSIAIPHECADSLVPVRCGRNESIRQRFEDVRTHP